MSYNLNEALIGLGFDLQNEVALQDDGDGIYIAAWNTEKEKPSEKELEIGQLKFDNPDYGKSENEILADKRAAMPALTPKQLKLVLALNGLTEEHILSMITSISDNQTKLIAEYEWRYALSFERTNPRTLMLASLMNLTDETVDELWGEAAKL